MNINIKNWKKFIDDEAEYSVGAGIPPDMDAFLSYIEEHEQQLDYMQFPVRELISRKWIKREKNEPLKNVFEKFLQLIGSEELPQNVLLRKTLHKNTKNPTNDYLLLAWSIRVLRRGIDECKKCHENHFQQENINHKVLRDIAKLSKFDDGPLRAKEYLANLGISLVIEKWLTGSKFNGASLRTKNGMPVIGLTLFYDRIDNFWFTMLHELVHVWKHLDNDDELFFDSTGRRQEDYINDTREEEADRIAQESLIPNEYLSHAAFKTHSSESVIELAEELEIHPAIIAGRVRHETKSWNILSDVVHGAGVRYMFKDVSW